MPTNLADGAAYISGPEQLVTPLVLLFDGSAFSRELEGAWASLIEPGFDPAIRRGKMDDAGALVGEITQIGFAQRLTPLQLRLEQPSWCVWVWGCDDLKPETVSLRLATYKPNPAARVEHIIVARLKDARTWIEWAKVGVLETVRAIFLLSENSPATRPLSVLAEAAAVHLYSSWKRYCQAQNGELGNALLLSPNYRLHCLGATCSAPDRDYHAARWAQHVEAHLLSAWQEQVGGASTGPIDSRLESLRALVRMETGAATTSYEIIASADVRKVRMQVASEKFVLLGAFAEKQCAPRRNYSSRDALMNWLASIRNFNQMLGFAALPNLNRIISSESPKLLKRWLGKIESFVTAEYRSRGFLKACRERLDASAEWCRQNSVAIVAGADARKSFAMNEGDCLKKIAALPDPIGVVLRLALPGICLTWLVLTPGLWMRPTFAWQAEFAHNGLLIATVGMGLLTAAAIGHTIFLHLRAVRAVERTRGDVIMEHFWAASSSVINYFSQNAEKVRMTVADWGKRFDALRDDIAKWSVSSDDLPANNNLFFPGESLDPLLNERLPAMVEEVHRRFQNSLSTAAFLGFDPAAFRVSIKEHARSVSKETVQKLTFEECLKARNASAEEKSHLLRDLVSEARMPTLDMPRPANPSRVTVTADTSWEEYASGSPRPDFARLPLQNLIAIGIIPVITD